MTTKTTLLTTLLLTLIISTAAANPPDRKTDAHVFLRGEPVTLSAPANPPSTVAVIRLLDEHFAEQLNVPVTNNTAKFGPLPVGWYRVEYLTASEVLPEFTTIAVLEPLATLPPEDTPIAVDIALAWLGADDQSDWPLYAKLARLAGVRWVRDRHHWREFQPEEGPFLDHTKYDDRARIQAAEDLKVLQVYHTYPKWARQAHANPERPQMDLAKLYTFCKEMAARFEDTVQAWEPWNEGNAHNFGGLTIEELCAIQKAAYLGYKAGNPDAIVCWNPLGGVNIDSHVTSLLRNGTWPYYDVYTIHSYDWPESYERLWGPARNAAGGKPIWVTESDRGMSADPDSDMGDFSPERDRRKAELVVQSYVRSLFSGASRHFHFILGHYLEGNHNNQFGLLRKDLTPRPGYVALAAMGRLLAGAEIIGRYEVEGQPNTHIYAFRAEPQGESRDVVVAWAEKPGDWEAKGQHRAPWPQGLSPKIESAYDYLGRPIDAELPAKLRPDPVFLVLPEGASDAATWRKVNTEPAHDGAISPVVFQFLPEDLKPVQRMIGWSSEAAYEFPADTTVDGTLVVYNLSDAPINGTVRIDDLPQGWQAAQDTWTVELGSMEQQALTCSLTLAPDAETGDVWLDFRGDFGKAGKPALSVWSREPPKE